MGVVLITQIVQETEDINDANFEQAINSSRTVLVYCWAAWCAPCNIMTPTIESLASEYRGKAKFCKLDADNSPDVASRFHIRSIPVVFIFVDGRLADEIIGAAPRQYVEARLKRHLK